MANETQETWTLEEKLYDLCLDIYAHAHLDCEITLCGNGTNACEASNVASKILQLLGKKVTDKEITKRAKEIEKEYE